MAASTALGQNSPSQKSGLDQIQTYIASGWDSLTRSPEDCKTIVDPKVAEEAVVYVPADFEISGELRGIGDRCHVRVEHLPSVIHRLGEIDAGKISPAGLLYLKNRYVVPGGRFNEMYGWDSYFIIRGLLRDGRIDLAQGMVENFFFEIEHYGAVLNANRTYYLTRSQPPFLTSMILAVNEAQKAAGREDRAWLARAYEYAVKDYGLWTRAPHLAGTTGLSRYYDFGDGPAPESLKDEPEYYRKVEAFFVAHPDTGSNELVSRNGKALLSQDYYKGDRAMRESGFDISFRFGPYGAETHHYAPVCLNSLLYKTQEDLAAMSEMLGRTRDAATWRKQAAERKARMQKYLWDNERGMYFDYDFEKGARSPYEYLTTFYPVWVGVASREQAKSVTEHLAKFEHAGGLAMSARETGAQWDYPYAWAPTQLLAVEGLRKYGYNDEANRISYKFLSTVLENFRREGTIREKYNAVTRSSETQVTAGYVANVVGFGWTNGVFLELLRALPATFVDRLSKDRAPVPIH